MLESQLHFISAILILLAAVVPIYLTVRLRNNLRKLVLVLRIFILVHAVYHIVGIFGLTKLAEVIFEPLSIAVLIFFGIVLSIPYVILLHCPLSSNFDYRDFIIACS
jgi:hypothetical protein